MGTGGSSRRTATQASACGRKEEVHGPPPGGWVPAKCGMAPRKPTVTLRTQWRLAPYELNYTLLTDLRSFDKVTPS